MSKTRIVAASTQSAPAPRQRPGAGTGGKSYASSTIPGAVFTMSTGIRKIHARTCPKHSDGEARCKCSPSWEAAVWDPAARRRLRRTFHSERSAKAWQADTTSGVNRGAITAEVTPTIREAGESLILGMRAGSVRNRNGETYKPSVVEGYSASLRDHVYPAMGARRLGDVRRQHVQQLVDDLAAARKQASTIRNVLMPLRVIYRRAIRSGYVAASPATALDLPAMRGRRERYATPGEARALLDALPPRDRAAWALGLYAGLRLGEIRALRWSDLDLDAGEIRVSRAWCNRTKQETTPKTPAAERTVPVAGELRRILLEHRLLTGRVGDGLVVTALGGGVESADAIQDRATAAWKAAAVEPITMHVARHSYASLAIAAGVPPKALQTFLGHASITTTFDRYGHLYPSERQTAAAALDRMILGAGEAL